MRQVKIEPGTPTLAIIAFQNVERPPGYIDRYLGALGEWNRDGLEETRLVVVSQKECASDVCAAAARQAFPVDVIHARHEFVGDYPVWDVLEEIRTIWPMIKARYVTFNHTEFIWLPGRLRRTLEYLKHDASYLVLGNLRRPGREEDRNTWQFPSCSKDVSDKLTQAMDSGRWHDAAVVAENLDTIRWMYWSPEQVPGPAKWLEDIFYCDKGWLDSWDWLNHGGRLPFQDVYDLVGVALQMQAKYQYLPKIMRMPLDANKLIHCWHPKEWASFTPRMRDWFLAHKNEWQDTRMIDVKLWNRLIECRGINMPKSEQPVIDLRRGPGGTVTRYAAAVSEYLRNGGGDRMKEFYDLHGRDGRVV